MLISAVFHSSVWFVLFRKTHSFLLHRNSHRNHRWVQLCWQHRIVWILFQCKKNIIWFQPRDHIRYHNHLQCTTSSRTDYLFRTSIWLHLYTPCPCRSMLRAHWSIPQKHPSQLAFCRSLRAHWSIPQKHPLSWPSVGAWGHTGPSL